MEETDETEHATSRINVGSTVFSHLSNFYNSIQNPEGQMSDCCAKKNFYHIKQRQLNPKPIFWRRIQFFEDSQSISELTVLKTPSEIERQKVWILFGLSHLIHSNIFFFVKNRYCFGNWFGQKFNQFFFALFFSVANSSNHLSTTVPINAVSSSLSFL